MDKTSGEIDYRKRETGPLEGLLSFDSLPENIKYVASRKLKYSAKVILVIPSSDESLVNSTFEPVRARRRSIKSLMILLLR